MLDTNVQTVKTLMVEDQFVGNKLLVSSVTVTGSGSQRPTYEAALCVKAGAQFDGLTEHGLLRVRGQSCMQGPLAVGNIYGPVTVSADPSAPNPDTVQLVVEGTAQTDALLAGDVTTEVLAAGTANIAVLNSTVLTVDGVLAGPFAPAEITALISDAVGVARFAVDESFKYFTCVAVGPGTFLVAVTSTVMASAMSSGYGASVPVYLPRYLGSAVSVMGQIGKIMPAGNLLTVTVDGLATSIFFDPETDLAGEVEDSPLPNTPLIVAFANASTGIVNFTTASVEDGFGQLFSEFTAVHIRPTSPLPSGALGAPIVNYRGKLVGLVQYGTPDAASAYNSSVYGTVTGGIKARFIKYFLATAAPSPAGTPIPMPCTSTTGPIRFTERMSASPPLVSGGVSANPGSTVLATQVLKVSVPETVAEVMGCYGVNFPNLPEFLLGTYGGPDSHITYTLIHASPASGTLTSAPGFASVIEYWNHGLPTAFTPEQNGLYSTAMTYVASGATAGLTLLSVPFSITGIQNTSGQFGVSTFGAVSDTQIHSGVIIAWGSKSELTNYFNGLTGAIPGLANTIQQAWNQFLTTITTVQHVLAVGGALPVGVTQTLQFVFSDHSSSDGTADFVVTGGTTAQTLVVSLNDSIIQTFNYAPLFGIFDLTVNGSSCKLYNTALSDTFSYKEGASSTLVAPMSTSVPSPLYPPLYP